MAMNAPVVLSRDEVKDARPGARAILGEKFVKTLFCEARHKALFGGRGSAKSWSVATYLPIVASNKTKRIVCARQFMNSIRDSSKELVEKRIRHLGLERQFTSTDRFLIHNETKSQFLFVGLDRNIESIRSLEGADIVWIEEARTIKARSMEVLLPTIRESGSELIWTWNPEQPEDPVDAYFRKGAPPPRSIITRVDYHDNPFFQASELPHEMEVMKAGNFERYKHVWLGEYDTHFDSKIFANVNIGRVSVASSVRPRYGMDLGFGSDPSFIVRLYVNEPAKQIYIAQEAVGRVTMDELPTLVRSVIANDFDLIICDSSQPGTIEFLQRRGLNIKPAKKGPGSVKDGINWLQGYEIWIDPDCEYMREEARLYSWVTDKLTGKVSNIPLDAYNHGWDATRYATEEYRSDLVDDDDPYGGVLKLKGW
jgi:phage terminase large subunit